MRVVVLEKFGRLDSLVHKEIPDPKPKAGHVVIEIKAFGINHAEMHMRRGEWAEAAKVIGIECVGLVKSCPGGEFPIGAKVAALMGGLGRTINGSYAEYTLAPTSNVASVETNMPWEDLAAIPESYATAWTCLHNNLALIAGQTVLIRGATSALGQAAVNIAAHLGAYVIATTRSAQRAAGLDTLGAQQVLLESTELQGRVRERHPAGIDAVLDLVGNTTVLDSLAMVRRDGRVCLAGFLGGGGPIAQLEPVFQIPSGRHLSVLATTLVTGNAEYPLSEIPFQSIVDRVVDGTYHAKPTRVFNFQDIREAHRLMESGQANGKIVIQV